MSILDKLKALGRVLQLKHSIEEPMPKLSKDERRLVHIASINKYLDGFAGWDEDSTILKTILSNLSCCKVYSIYCLVGVEIFVEEHELVEVSKLFRRMMIDYLFDNKLIPDNKINRELYDE